MPTATITFVIALTSAAHPNVKGDAVASFVQRTIGPGSYKRADADLNSDGRKESFVYLTDQDSCGSGGCTLVVLSPTGSSYRVVARTTITQLPITMLATSTHGWRDIGVTVAGGGITQPYMVRLRFNGHRYPDNPSMLPHSPANRPTGTELIAR